MPNGKRLSSGKDQDIMPREELISCLPREFPENTLRPISHDRTANRFPTMTPIRVWWSPDAEETRLNSGVGSRRPHFFTRSMSALFRRK